MSTLAFIDTETDGLHHLCRPWEVAIIRRDEDGNEHSQSWFLPLDLRHADPMALRIGGFWDRHPMGRKVSGKEATPCAPVTGVHEFARDFMRLTFGVTLVGSAPWFDADVLARILRSEGYMPQWSHRLRDVATLVSGVAGKDVGGLDGAMKHLGMSMPEADRHTAVGDARMARDIYDRVMQP